MSRALTTDRKNPPADFGPSEPVYRAWGYIERILTDGAAAPELGPEFQDALFELEAEFRRRCRRLDRERKRTGGRLLGDAKQAQRQGRAAFNGALRALQSMAEFDLSDATSRDWDVVREKSGEMAALLIMEKSLFRAGGLTVESLRRFQEPKN